MDRAPLQARRAVPRAVPTVGKTDTPYQSSPSHHDTTYAPTGSKSAAKSTSASASMRGSSIAGFLSAQEGKA